jgi:hypothetical protein
MIAVCSHCGRDLASGELCICSTRRERKERLMRRVITHTLRDVITHAWTPALGDEIARERANNVAQVLAFGGPDDGNLRVFLRKMVETVEPDHERADRLACDALHVLATSMLCVVLAYEHDVEGEAGACWLCTIAKCM